MTDDIKKDAQEAVDKIADGAKKVSDKASDKIDQGVHYGKEHARDLADKAGAAADRFHDSFDDFSDYSKGKARDLRDEFLNSLNEENCACPAALFTRQRPLLGLALAALIGFVLGRIIRRRG
ncbi:hypothetical protein FAI40_02325 [Acetobacteraceae bacterium]|nr:hypothetical protein FAI40_02325 [Acetobacteraceae bacterium]